MKRELKLGTVIGRGFLWGAVSLSAAGMAAPAFALDDNALPSGGVVAGGSASFDYSAPNELHVHQSSDRAVIDWDGFNIGAGALTQFHQPGSSSIAVNRVTGSGDPTQILGTLKANGIVMVLDRNGVIFGENSRVDVGGIIASTGSIDDGALMAGGNVALKDIDTGSAIINHGSISVADAGLAAFVAPTVVNSGIIEARLGKVILASGDTATLDLYGDGLIELAVENEEYGRVISNTGLIHADGGTIQITAAAAKGIVNSVINLDGVVSASSATVKGGKIVLGADTITLAETATLDASSTAGKGGEIILYANDEAHIAGTIRAAGSTDADVGFIETSAVSRVTIADTARIDSGNGQWLIDPTNFTIANSGGDITTATLAAQLALNNVTIETADAGSDGGDIFVNNTLNWTGNKTLTLKANRNIEVNAAISNTTGGSLVLRADKNGTGTGTVIFGASGSAAMSGGGRTDIYYNPTAYTAPTNYSAKVTGTNTAWMLVNNVTQLQAMSMNLAGSYALGKDIDASDTVNWNAGAGFDPIGNTGAIFTGQFDGLGHTITGLAINRPTTDYVGLFGYTNYTGIKNVRLVNANIVGRDYVGGLLGSFQNYTGGINNVLFSGTLSGRDYVGGIVGRYHASSIKNSRAEGTITGRSSVGGIVGYGLCTVQDTYSSATVMGSSRTGGLVGWSNGGTVLNSYATGAVSGGVDTGGLIGNVQGGTVTNSYATGSVTGTGSNTGGLVGTTSGSISGSYATGNVAGSNYVGGLAGYSTGSVSTSYAQGDVLGALYVGGLIGRTDLTTMLLSNSYATGDTSGTDYVGGLLGWRYNSSIESSYATGAVSGGANTGGLVGRSNGVGTVTNSYWNTETSGQSTSAGGTGLTTAQMMQMASFSGWSIRDAGTGTTWRIYEGYTAPLLASFLTPLTVSAADMTITYNGAAFAGGNATYMGLKSGDTAAALSGTLAYGGTAQGAIDAGTYGITLAGGLYSGQRGYDISYSATPATLTIGKRDITAAVHDDSRAYGDANPAWDWTDVTWSNLVSGEDGSVLDSVIFTAPTLNAAANAGSAQSIGITSFSDNNYNLTGYTAGNLTITKRDITATVHNDARAYGDANPAWDWSDVTWNNLANSEDGSVLDALIVSSSAGATSNAGSAQTITLSGFSDNNYNLAGFTAGILTIGKRDITAAVKDGMRAYGAANPAWDWSHVTWNNLANGEDGSVLDAFLLSSEAGATSEGVHDITLTGFSDNNYNLTGFTAGRLTIGAKPILMSTDIVRIVNAKLTATNPETAPPPDAVLIGRDKGKANNGLSFAGCLAAMKGGACFIH